MHGFGFALAPAIVFGILASLAGCTAPQHGGMAQFCATITNPN